ncbi:MAG: hypothetical protein WBK91_02980 [Alphaproteobacteria bacterium]
MQLVIIAKAASDIEAVSRRMAARARHIKNIKRPGTNEWLRHDLGMSFMLKG